MLLACFFHRRIIMKFPVLQKLLKNDDAFLIFGEVSRKYLTCFSSSDGYLLVKKDEACFFVDARYFEDAQKKIDSCEVELFDGFDRIKRHLDGTKNIIVESNYVTLRQFEKLKGVFSPVAVNFGDEPDGELQRMRAIKSEDEIASLKTAQKIAEIAFDEALRFLKAGVSENAVAAFIEYVMRKNGGEKLSFDTIVVSGASGSVPHGVPGEKIISKGEFVTMDFGTVYGGYHSDMTRTVVVGRASERQRNIYNAVLEAQEKAIKAVKPGLKCSDLDKVARDHLSEKGFGEFFTHSLGHGVGLEIHEAPTVSAKCDRLLECGNVITVEPGVYIPGELGVRIEDFGLVTENGFDNFTKADKNLIEIV